MEPLANYNPQCCCWNCTHFQRYDSTLPRPERCDGECRLDPVKGSIFTIDFMPDPQNREDFGHNKETSFVWPHITCGLRMRCKSFEKSKEIDLPQSPLSFNCQHTAPTFTAEWESWIKPNKKDKNCFTCAWFEPALCQRKNDAQLDNGCCLYYPPGPRQFHFFEQMMPRADFGATPTIRGALSLWCSKWEGPRPAIGYSPDDKEPVKSALDAYALWEDRRSRLVWLSALHLAQVKKVQAEAQAKAQSKKPRIVTLENIERIK